LGREQQNLTHARIKGKLGSLVQFSIRTAAFFKLSSNEELRNWTMMSRRS
jgi:hypothetical protein